MLICDGVGTAPSSSSTSAAVYGPNGLASGQVTTVQTVRSNERFMVELEGERVRVGVPRPMVPPLNGGGDAGWWALDGVEMTDTSVSGRFRFNLLNKPTVTISRVTGDIDVRGSFSFQGQCVPAPQGQRLF